MDLLTWSWTGACFLSSYVRLAHTAVDRLLPPQLQEQDHPIPPPFSQSECQELLGVLRSFGGMYSSSFLRFGSLADGCWFCRCSRADGHTEYRRDAHHLADHAARWYVPSFPFPLPSSSHMTQRHRSTLAPTSFQTTQAFARRFLDRHSAIDTQTGLRTSRTRRPPFLPLARGAVLVLQSSWAWACPCGRGRGRRGGSRSGPEESESESGTDARRGGVYFFAGMFMSSIYISSPSSFSALRFPFILTVHPKGSPPPQRLNNILVPPRAGL